MISRISDSEDDDLKIPCQDTSLAKLASKKPRIKAEIDEQFAVGLESGNESGLLDVSKIFEEDLTRENDEVFIDLVDDNFPSTSKISKWPSEEVVELSSSDESSEESSSSNVVVNMARRNQVHWKTEIIKDEESEVIARVVGLGDESLEEIEMFRSEVQSDVKMEEMEDDSFLETSFSARDRSMDPPIESYSQTNKRSKISLNPNRFQIPFTPFEMADNQRLIRYAKLDQSTKEANANERARIQRLMEKCEMLEENFPGHRDSNELLLDYDLRRGQKIVVHQRIVIKLKSHQKEAVRFLYDNCIGSVNDVARVMDCSEQTYQGTGVVLAHCMGLGKTLTTIALIATVSRCNQLKTRQILILCPKSTILNWVDEFVRWIGDFFKIRLFFFAGDEDLDQKMIVLENWKRASICDPSVLLLGYEAFRNLVLLEKSQLSKNKFVQINPEEYEAKIKKFLIDGTEMIVLVSLFLYSLAFSFFFKIYLIFINIL